MDKHNLFQKKNLNFYYLKVDLPQNLHEDALQNIRNNLIENMLTSEMFNQVNEFLNKNSPMHKAKCSLNQAIMNLYSTGYSFEDYISKIMQAQGYDTWECVNH